MEDMLHLYRAQFLSMTKKAPSQWVNGAITRDF